MKTQQDEARVVPPKISGHFMYSWKTGNQYLGILGCDHVPPKLFDVMTELCAKYAPRKLNLSKVKDLICGIISLIFPFLFQIYFNGDFARKLEDALNGSMPNHLELTGCGFRDMQL